MRHPVYKYKRVNAETQGIISLSRRFKTADRNTNVNDRLHKPSFCQAFSAYSEVMSKFCQNAV